MTRRLVAVLLTLTLAAACSGGDDDASIAPSSTTAGTVTTTTLVGDAAVLATADAKCEATTKELHAAAGRFYPTTSIPTAEMLQTFLRDQVLPVMRQQVSELRTLPLEQTDLGPTLDTVSARLDDLDAVVAAGPDDLLDQAKVIYEAMVSAFTGAGLPHCGAP